MTAPEEKAILSPSLMSSFTVHTVLEEELVAVLIPMFPARAERKAPKRKTAPETLLKKSDKNPRAVRIAATTIAYTTITLYSPFRNAMAPSLMAEAISFTFSDSTSIDIMYLKIRAAAASPRRDIPMVTYM